MNTQDQEAVEAARYQARCWLDERVRESIERAFLAGVEWQKRRTVDILKEPPPLGYGMDWYIEKITGIKQRENPVNGELEGDD